jgi:mRNA interferase MazF
MYKDYKFWSKVKSKINNQIYFFFGIKEREIWYVNLGENVGFEEDGKGNWFIRPVLVLKVFSSRLCFVVPITSKEKKGKFYFEFNFNKEKKSWAILSQFRTLDSLRFVRKIGILSKEEFSHIKNKITNILSL